MSVRYDNDNTIHIHNFNEIYERTLDTLRGKYPEQFQVHQRRHLKMNDL